MFGQGELSSHDGTAAEAYTFISSCSMGECRRIIYSLFRYVLPLMSFVTILIILHQISALCNGINGTVSPFTALTTIDLRMTAVIVELSACNIVVGVDCGKLFEAFAGSRGESYL